MNSICYFHVLILVKKEIFIKMIRLCILEVLLNFLTLTTTFFLFSFYCVLLPMVLGFWQELLSWFHLGILWTCLLFSFLPEKFFAQDQQDGTLELYYLSRFSPLSLILFSKLLGLWFLKILGILCSYLLLSFFYNFDFSFFTCITLILGSLNFLLVCSFHSCLTIALQNMYAQNGLHYLTTIPSLLPLLLLCNSVQVETGHFFFLFALIVFYFFMFFLFGSQFIKKTLSE